MKVNAVGPHVHEGRLYQKGEEMEMSEEQRDWYTKMVLAGRQEAQANPMVAAIAASTMPADRTAHPNVETKIASDERDTSLGVGNEPIQSPNAEKTGETMTRPQDRQQPARSRPGAASGGVE